MPCLNAERFILAATNSVFAQTLEDLELIVIDNGSTDHTLETVRSISEPRMKVLSLQKRGVSWARNFGLTHARGTFVAFLDSDDTWNCDFLEKLYSALASNPQATLAYCGWQNVGLPGPRGDPFVPPDYETPDKAAALLEGCRWPIHACLTRRAAINDTGGFNTQLAIGEDYLLWMEVSATGTIVRVPEVLAQYHHHDGVQATKNITLAALDTLKAKNLFLARHPQIAETLGTQEINELTWGKLLQSGNELYWRGDVENARPLFRKTLLSGYGTIAERLRMLPSILPLWLHKTIVASLERYKR